MKRIVKVQNIDYKKYIKNSKNKDDEMWDLLEKVLDNMETNKQSMTRAGLADAALPCLNIDMQVRHHHAMTSAKESYKKEMSEIASSFHRKRHSENKINRSKNKTDRFKGSRTSNNRHNKGRSDNRGKHWDNRSRKGRGGHRDGHRDSHRDGHRDGPKNWHRDNKRKNNTGFRGGKKNNFGKGRPNDRSQRAPPRQQRSVSPTLKKERET